MNYDPFVLMFDFSFLEYFFAKSKECLDLLLRLCYYHVATQLIFLEYMSSYGCMFGQINRVLI